MKNINQLFIFLLITPAIALYSGNKNIKDKSSIENKHSIHEAIAQSIVQKNKKTLLNQKEQIKKSIIFFQEAIRNKAIFRDKNDEPTGFHEEVENYCIIDIPKLEEDVFKVWLCEKTYGCIPDFASNQYIKLKESAETVNNETVLGFKLVYKIVSEDEFRIIAKSWLTNDQALILLQELVNLYTAILHLL